MADVEAVTEVVVTVKVALVAPAGTMMVAGTVAALELHDSVTVPPPLSAGALKVTVPVAGVPPTTLIGFNDTVERTGPGGGGVTVRMACVNTSSVPVKPTLVNTPTGLVFTVNVALVAPAGTVTLAGKVASDELLASVTTDPPAAAGSLRVTVPVETLPPTTVLGVKKSPAIDTRLKNRFLPIVAPS